VLLLLIRLLTGYVGESLPARVVFCIWQVVRLIGVLIGIGRTVESTVCKLLRRQIISHLLEVNLYQMLYKTSPAIEDPFKFYGTACAALCASLSADTSAESSAGIISALSAQVPLPGGKYTGSLFIGLLRLTRNRLSVHELLQATAYDGLKAMSHGETALASDILKKGLDAAPPHWIKRRLLCMGT
jgi:hypothetical protein